MTKEIEVEQMTSDHPVRRAMSVLRVWLIMVSGVMAWNAAVSNEILLTDWVRPLPFLFLAVVALVWANCTWRIRAVLWCCSLITVGVVLRALEVFIFADNYNLRARATGVSLWITLAGTTISFGIINVLAISRRSAEEAIWSHKHSQQ